MRSRLLAGLAAGALTVAGCSSGHHDSDHGASDRGAGSVAVHQTGEKMIKPMEVPPVVHVAFSRDFPGMQMIEPTQVTNSDGSIFYRFRYRETQASPTLTVTYDSQGMRLP